MTANSIIGLQYATPHLLALKQEPFPFLCNASMDWII